MSQTLTQKSFLEEQAETLIGAAEYSRIEDMAKTVFKPALLLVFLMALGIRVLYLSEAWTGPLGNPDSEAYQALAETVRKHEPYSTAFSGGPGGFPADLQRPPGYPVFLSLINPASGVSRQWTGVVQSVFGAVFALVLVLVVRRLVDPLAALLAGVFYALDWVTILHTPILTADVVYSVVLSLGVVAYALHIRSRKLSLAIAAGFLVGVSALIKPSAQVVLLAPMIISMVPRGSRRAGMFLLLAYLVCVTPWMVRNYNTHGLFTLSAIGTSALYFYTAEGSKIDNSSREVTSRVNDLDQKWSSEQLSPADRKQSMESDAWREIREHWPAVLKQAAVGFARCCFGTGRETTAVTLGGRDIKWFWATALPFAQIFILWGFAAVGVVASLKRLQISASIISLLAFVVFLVILPAAAPLGYSRYRVPAVPALCVLAALGASRMMIWLDRRAMRFRVRPIDMAYEAIITGTNPMAVALGKPAARDGAAPTKVVRIIDRLNIGGPAKHVVWLTAGLNKDRYDTTLITGVVPPGEGDMSYFARERDVEPIVIDEMSRELSPRDVIVIWKLLRLFLRIKPRIIHTHKAKAGAAGRVAAMIYKLLTPSVLWLQPRECRVVHTYHGHVFHSYYGRLKTSLFVLIERALARICTDQIIVVSEQQRREICESFHIGRPEQFRVVPLGLEFDELGNTIGQLRKEFGIKTDEITVGIVGRICEVKNHAMLLESAARLISARTGAPPRFVIVGDGHLRLDIERQARDLGVADNVLFTGFRKDATTLYPDFDIVALTSLNEGTPLTLIEAMGCGRPVAATEVGGVVDVMGDRRASQDGFSIWDHGVTAPSRDADAFARALQFLIERPELRRQMGERGRSFVRTNLSKDRLVTDIESTYRSLIDSSNETSAVEPAAQPVIFGGKGSNL